MHGHTGGASQGTPAEYVLKLWMGHGITTVRDPGSMNGLDWILEHKAKSEKNEITASRIKAYVWFGQGRKEPVATPEQARAWVAEVAGKGADGLKQLAPPGPHAGNDRRGPEAGYPYRRPSCANGRRLDERAGCRPSGPNHSRALVRSARGAVH